MKWENLTWSVFFRILDGVALTLLFIFQQTILNMIIIRAVGDAAWPWLFVISDLTGLFILWMTLVTVGCETEKKKKKKKKRREEARLAALRNNSVREVSSVDDGSCLSGSVAPAAAAANRPSSRGSTHTYVSEYEFNPDSCCGMYEFPMAYMSWIYYSVLLMVKIWIIFTQGMAQGLKTEDFFGPQLFKFTIGMSALIFSMVVAGHKDAKKDPVRNAYLNNLCYRVALEILDSASFLGLLLPSESRIVYPFALENAIMTLAFLNLFLPSMTLYKLCATDFGRNVSFPVDTWYRIIHIILIDGAFFSVRVYLWSMFTTDTSIFMIKNLYALLNFGRELRGDFRECKDLCTFRRDEVEMGGTDLGGGGGEGDMGDGDEEDDDDDDDDGSLDSMGGEGIGLKNFGKIGYNARQKRERSISTRGIHGSAQSSQTYVFAVNSDTSQNGYSGKVGNGSGEHAIPVDRSNSRRNLYEDATMEEDLEEGHDQDEDRRHQALIPDAASSNNSLLAIAFNSSDQDVPTRDRNPRSSRNK